MQRTPKILKNKGFWFLFTCLMVTWACTPPPNDENADTTPTYPTSPAPQLNACITDPQCSYPLVVSHRGEGSNHPENAISAIKSVAAIGADIVEIDIRMSQDGIPILMHDDTLKRTTDQETLFPQQTKPQDLTLEELKQLTLYDPEGLCEQNNLDETTFLERCRIPTLKEAILAAKDLVILMLDYKSGSLEAIAQVINDTQAQNHVFFFDADHNNLETMETWVTNLVTMPRASDANSTAQIIQERTPHLLHIDPGYLDDAFLSAQENQTKLFLNLFLISDLYLIGDELGGNSEDNRDLAATGINDMLDRGAQLVQTNRPKETRELCDAWLMLSAQ